ncbi:MAG: hypothetical protein AAGA54_09240 [Myxococcota bacterium]
MTGALSIALAALLAGPASDDWEPASSPPPTAWARAGARPWRSCDAAARPALAVRLGMRGRGKFEPVWRGRAKHCPGAPDILVLAAQESIIEAVPKGWMPEAESDLDGSIADHRAAAQEAIAFIDRALEESARQGAAAPFEAYYLQAYAASMLGDAAGVRKSLKHAAEVGDAERWRIERMRAVAAMYEGKLDEAVRLAHLARVDAPHDASERQISRYVWALILDRAGASASARAVFRQLRREPGSLEARPAVESMLPPHERMFLRAIEHQAHAETTNASRLWDAYLQRPEPSEADRALAMRHRDELRR